MIVKFTPPRIRQLAAIGVALSMLFLGCERDEVQKTGNPNITQQEAMNLFLKTYKNNEDEFRDKVVERLLEMNDSTGIIYDLVHKYGQPRWEIEKTISKKSENFLFVPIKSKDKDSISAVFGFIDSLGHKYLKIYDAQSLDTVVSDFVLYYQFMLYPETSYANRIVKSHEKGSKDFILDTCWDVYYSTDGGTTLTYSYTFCKEAMVYISFAVHDLYGGGPGDYGSDILSGDGVLSSGITPTARNVTSSEKKALDEKKKELDNDWCPNATVTDDWSSIKFMIDAALKYNGLYDPSSNTVILRPDGTTADLLHEVFHHYQNQFYVGGTSQYRTDGKVNIEFETWMYIDVYLARNGNKLRFTNYINDADTKEKWQDWISDIAKNGLTDSNLADYEDWVDIFNNYMPAEYRSKKNPDLSRPNAAINALKCLNL